MRFLHVAAVYPPYPGGMSFAAREAAEGLAARGHEVVVATLALKEQPGVTTENGVTVHRLAAWPKYGLAGWPSGLRALARESWDGVLVHWPFFGGQELLALLQVGGWKPRSVVYYHMDVQAAGMVKAVARAARYTSLPVLLRHADVVMASSGSYAESSWLRDSWSMVEPKLVINPFGVDIKRFAPGETTSPKRVVFVGGLDRPHYFKGLSVLLSALAGLKDRADWELDVVGDGELRVGYERQANELRIAHRVRFLGRVPEAEKAAAYRGAYVHVLPSLDRSEAFGLVVLEAQASGVPSIVSDLPGVREAVAAPATGVTVPPGDVEALRAALSALLDDPERQQAMGQAARARVESGYTWQRHLDRLEKALISA